MYKFRSMVIGAEDILKELLEKDEDARKEWEENRKLKRELQEIKNLNLSIEVIDFRTYGRVKLIFLKIKERG